MNNQAKKLKYFVEKNIINDSEEAKKELNEETKTRIIAVASGKGGVGKSTISVNLSLALRELNRNVLIVDCDIGMANVDVLLGLKSQYDLNHVLKGQCTLKEAVETGSYGLSVLSGISGLGDVVNISTENIKHLLAGVAEIEKDYDVVILDTGAGASQSVINFVTAADEVMIVLTPEPTAIMDSYSLIKILYNKEYQGKINLIVNRTESQKETDGIVKRFLKTANDYLNLDVQLMGTIPQHKHISKSVKEQHPVFKLYPDSEANEPFLKIAGKLVGEEPELPSRGIKSFFYKLVGQLNPRG